MPHTFRKSEHLRSKKTIEALFERNAAGFFRAPFRFSWKLMDGPQPASCQVLIVVPKKNFHHATTRNRIRRQLRELYRINKQVLIQPLVQQQRSMALMIRYSGAAEMIFQQTGPIFATSLKKIALAVQKDHPSSFPVAHPVL
jgi:ribonuclease P protein component